MKKYRKCPALIISSIVAWHVMPAWHFFYKIINYLPQILNSSWIQKLIPQLFEKSTAVDDTVGWVVFQPTILKFDNHIKFEKVPFINPFHPTGPYFLALTLIFYHLNWEFCNYLRRYFDWVYVEQDVILTWQWHNLKNWKLNLKLSIIF